MPSLYACATIINHYVRTPICYREPSLVHCIWHTNPNRHTHAHKPRHSLSLQIKTFELADMRVVTAPPTSGICLWVTVERLQRLWSHTGQVVCVDNVTWSIGMTQQSTHPAQYHWNVKPLQILSVYCSFICFYFKPKRIKPINLTNIYCFDQLNYNERSIFKKICDKSQKPFIREIQFFVF